MRPAPRASPSRHRAASAVAHLANPLYMLFPARPGDRSMQPDFGGGIDGLPFTAGLGSPQALAMSATELARRIKVPTNRVTQVLNGQRAISGDTVLRLGHFFGTRAEFWLNLQKELGVAEREFSKTVKPPPTLADHGSRSRAACVSR